MDPLRHVELTIKRGDCPIVEFNKDNTCPSVARSRMSLLRYALLLVSCRIFTVPSLTLVYEGEKKKEAKHLET